MTPSKERGNGRDVTEADHGGLEVREPHLAVDLPTEWTLPGEDKT